MDGSTMSLAKGEAIMTFTRTNPLNEDLGRVRGRLIDFSLCGKVYAANLATKQGKRVTVYIRLSKKRFAANQSKLRVLNPVIVPR
ncbi:hypothetical protein KC887_03120 [Candidatus Kaiserbacteria bacterium]|nr:hypothetical protein [Candidatus Kaiserbacteria bacterium]